MGRWLEALKDAKTYPRQTDKTDKNTETPFLSVLSVPSGAENENFSADREASDKSEKPNAPLERGRVIPFPGAEWSPDTTPKPDDPERYADALLAYGPMSYGMAMRILGWGGTRAGQAEDALRKQGRIAFDKFGRAVLKTEDKTP
ncbi:hypothetical protein [Phyllobacterium leguminum]|uniref:Uncharacterized protein n=1 Tax=Phyllobacterium leguminum TaxID=314237 RepID=A0A318T6A6_9HYPH|nr:hypothetical protein [Phyllobacterium leguminum]PYE88774.1 hypothetical protein C7477_106147 [Phyllobacterium leguminum]